MNDPRDPLLGGLERRPVLCAHCGSAWDERLVAGSDAADPDPGLCPACLLLTRHGEQPPVVADSGLSDPYPSEPAPVLAPEVA